MNDYFAGRLAHERQADYMREVERDELVAEAHGARSDEGAPAPSHGHLAPAARRSLRSVLDRLGPSRLVARSHRP